MWEAWLRDHVSLDMEEYWAMRPLLIDDPDWWLCPPLGQVDPPRPELRLEPGGAVCERVWMATDGMEFPDRPAGSLAGNVTAMMTRERIPPYPYPHGDIAALEVRVT